MNQKKRELEQNELADALGQRIEKIKPYLPRIALIGGTVLLAIVAVAFWMSQRDALSEVRWREYFFSKNQSNFFGDPRGLDKVAEMFPESQPGQLALLGAADFNYAVGATSVVQNRGEFNSKLESAVFQYEQVLASPASVDPLIKRRATFALAYTNEALGKFSIAADLYRRIVDDAPESAIATLAQKGFDRVNDQSLTSIYDAFREWQPEDKAPGTGPLLPMQPDISFPAADDTADPPPSLDADKTSGDSISNGDDETGDKAAEDKSTESDKKADEQKKDDQGG